MRILITGSSGFIGSYLMDTLLQANKTVLGLDIHPPRNDKLTPYFTRCNLLDEDSLVTVFKDFKPESILHLAARTDLNEEAGLAGYASNIKGVENLITAIRFSDSVNRCVFTSSQLVCRVGYIPSGDNDYAPSTLYGESKVQTERLVRELDGGGCTWCLVRPTTIWGPGMSAHYQRFFKMILKGRYFHVSKKPLYKSYGYIGNVAYQYLKLLEVPAEKIHRHLFYLADYEPISLRDWTNKLQQALGAPQIPTYSEKVVRLCAWIGDLLSACGLKKFPFNSFRLNNITTEYCYNMSKTAEVCGPLPVSFEEGIKATANWIKTL
jgi:GlcNAc-P-P-Und epimerase